MARLVAVSVLSHHPRDIGRSIRRQLGTGGKQSIELLDEGFPAPEQLDVPGRIVLYKKRRLPWIRLRVVPPAIRVAHLRRRKRRRPLPSLEPRPNESSRRIKKILVVLRSLDQKLVVVHLAECLRDMSDRPVVVDIFHGLAGGLFFFVARNVPELAVIAQTAVVIVHRAPPERGINLAEINSLESFDAGFRVNRT